MGHNVTLDRWTPGLGPTMGHNATLCLYTSLGSTMNHVVTTVTGPRALAQLWA
ncbi:hypothetical protein HAX54_006156, partial [Datura stramonium]|nr:hypothetical protein [Datura stramonium]